MSKKQKSSKRTQSAHRAENRSRSWARGEERHRINRVNNEQAHRENLAVLNENTWAEFQSVPFQHSPSKTLRLNKREEQRARDRDFEYLSRSSEPFDYYGTNQ